LHYLFEVLLFCCVAPYELSRYSTPFTGRGLFLRSNQRNKNKSTFAYYLPQSYSEACTHQMMSKFASYGLKKPRLENADCIISLRFYSSVALLLMSSHDTQLLSLSDAILGLRQHDKKKSTFAYHLP